MELIYSDSLLEETDRAPCVLVDYLLGQCVLAQLELFLTRGVEIPCTRPLNESRPLFEGSVVRGLREVRVVYGRLLGTHLLSTFGNGHKLSPAFLVESSQSGLFSRLRLLCWSLPLCLQFPRDRRLISSVSQNLWLIAAFPVSPIITCSSSLLLSLQHGLKIPILSDLCLSKLENSTVVRVKDALLVFIEVLI
jgi:hypothetical protein